MNYQVAHDQTESGQMERVFFSLDEGYTGALVFHMLFAIYGKFALFHWVLQVVNSFTFRCVSNLKVEFKAAPSGLKSSENSDQGQQVGSNN